MLRLVPLEEETLYEYIFERYMELESNIGQLSQDLGIQSRNQSAVEIDIFNEEKSKVQNKDAFTLTIEQSLTSLNSSQDNNNSTTGYVLWTTSCFMIKWLLYNEHSKIFTKGGHIDNVDIPSMFQYNQDENMRCILELGTGISPIFPIIFSNYLDKYVATDQMGILSKLKYNIQQNQQECRRRLLRSNTIELAELKRRTELECELDVVQLDWELFTDKTKRTDPVLLSPEDSHITIIAMDVIYNDYLINPFLKTLKALFEWYTAKKCTVCALIGIQLRTEDVVESFLESCVIEHQFKVYAVDEEQLNKSRFILLYATL